jgi:hypothetical protein
MTQESLFTAIDARDEAVDRVGRNAGEEWLEAATRIVADVARRSGRFTTDDVWVALEAADLRPREPRALGAVMRLAARRGLVTATTAYTPSSRVECHARPVRVWEDAR